MSSSTARADRSGATTSGERFVTTEDELRAVVPDPDPRVAAKVRTHLDEVDLAFLAASPFCLVATSDAEGRVDASPKGDPASIAHVLDERTLVLAERSGNRRLDGYRNVLANPQVGLLFLVPGRGDTLRVNGRARVVSDAPWFDHLVVRGNRPPLALRVDVTEVFFHCSKAFLRSQLWKPDTWRPDDAPSSGRILRTVLPADDALVVRADRGGDFGAEELYPGS